jgi:hypothetical protein
MSVTLAVAFLADARSTAVSWPDAVGAYRTTTAQVFPGPRATVVHVSAVMLKALDPVREIANAALALPPEFRRLNA